MSIEKKLEETLFKLVKRGDESAFEMLFKLYYSDLCSYAVTFVKIPEIAEEIVQETFINIWQKRNSIDIDVSWKAYVYRAIHNRCLNHLKRSRVLKKLDQETHDDIIYHHQIVIKNLDPDILDRLISEELATTIRNELEKLPVQCRKIFLLSRQEQLTYPEIAEKLNLSLNTVKTQMKRALNKLHEAIDKHLGE